MREVTVPFTTKSVVFSLCLVYLLATAEIEEIDLLLLMLLLL